MNRKKSNLRTESWITPIYTGQRDKGEIAKNEWKRNQRKKWKGKEEKKAECLRMQKIKFSE